VNLKSRLARLEQGAAPPGGYCSHLPPVVVTEDEDGGEVFEQRAETTDTRVCWCGRGRLRIRIVYTETWPDNGRGAETK